MFRIGEFSKLAQVSIRMLRYYDELGLLKPAHVDRFTNYRLYSPDQLEPIQKITLLRDLGFTVTEIKETLNNWDATSIRARLIARREAMLCNIALEQQKINRLQFALDELTGGEEKVTYDIKIKPVPDFLVLSLRGVVDNYYCEGGLWERLSDFIAKSGYQLPSNPLYFSICHDEDFKETDVDLEVCIPVNKTAMGYFLSPPREKNAGKCITSELLSCPFAVKIESTDDIICHVVEGSNHMASLMVSGPYHRLAMAYKNFAYWLESDDNYELAKISRQVYHIGPWNDPDPEKYLTEIQMPLALKKPA